MRPSARQVVALKGTAALWSPKVLRAGMGAHFSLDIFERIDLIAAARVFPGRVLVTQLRAAQSVFQTDLTGTVALVFGSYT